ncbi:hypothetical protein SAY86_025465 [Trapa natans]|uniref:Uncharacterized protein n=1 Tax=Trapa natans TaxID=22666 RepID=A0AAN7M699_TRANT|nr:hypothetical protein SAY86_025465 [Trapa natans]
MSLQVVVGWWRIHMKWRMLYVIFLGQIVSFTLAVVSLTSSLIADLGSSLVHSPTLKHSKLAFSLLSAYVVHEIAYSSAEDASSWFPGIGISSWGSLMLKEIILRSIKLLNPCSKRSVPVHFAYQCHFARLLDDSVGDNVDADLGTRYSVWQLIGAVLSVIGLGLVMLSDAGVGGGGGSKPLLGDVIVIAGTVFMAMSNVREEFFVKKKDLVELLTMLPLFGLLVSAVQISIAERTTLESLQWTRDRILAFAGFAGSAFVFYSLTPFVLRMSGAAMFNLSMLTSDMWAVVFRIFIYHQEVDWLYYVCFAVVVIGIVVYSLMAGDPDEAVTSSMENGTHTGYQLLNDETGADRADDSRS